LIDFRYHIVSIVAVFLALALGLFLGSTTLQSTVTHSLRDQADRLTSTNSADDAKIKLLGGELGSEQALTAAAEPYIVQDRLSGTTVALISAPGVDSKLRKSVAATLQFSGATVTSDVQIQASYLDPTQDAELGGLASSLALPNRPLPQGNGATEVSSELAAVLLTRPGRHSVASSRIDATLTALEVGKFISVAGNQSQPVHPATMAVFLVAAPNTSESLTLAQSQNTELLTLASDLRSSSTATVVAGPDPVAGVAGSTLAAARADSLLTKSVSTVDFANNDLAAGRIAIVLALANAPDGTVGAYGLGSSDKLPIASATP
jgi:Copper transport outer membrane protein, MctB